MHELVQNGFWKKQNADFQTAIVPVFVALANYYWTIFITLYTGAWSEVHNTLKVENNIYMPFYIAIEHFAVPDLRGDSAMERQAPVLCISKSSCRPYLTVHILYRFTEVGNEGIWNKNNKDL